jgi:predicted O-linked N-acetylglucosamine transferase (SPINDLY family)
MAVQHHRAGRLDAAEQIYRQILAVEPNHAEAWHLLGVVHLQRGAHPLAIDCISRAIALSPQASGFHFNLGNVYLALNQWDQAAACYRRALALSPDSVEVHCNLGTAFERQGQWDEAIACYGRAIQLNPIRAEVHNRLGGAFTARGRLDEAAACYRRMLELQPGSAEAHYNLGTTLQEQRKLDDAVVCYRRALELNPDYLQAHNNLGAAFQTLGKMDDAVACFRRTLELRPDHAGAHDNLATCCNALGRQDEAILHHRQAVELEPGNAKWHSDLLYALNYHPDHDAATLFAEHRAWGERHADPLSAVSLPHANDRSAVRRLRIGYVSPFFRSHAVTVFSEPILASHNHADFEIFCYSDVERPDTTSERLRGYADQWRDIVGWSDERVADLVRADRIDILVDLTGHIIGGQRLLVFARKPSPIQVTYLGYQNTTGMLAMDYRLSDDYSDPPGTTEHWHTETLVRLPRTFFCYLPSSDAPPLTPPPATVNGYVTFGSINNYAKVTPQVLATWAEILVRIPDSRLLVRADMTESLQQHLRATFATHGISAERLELVDSLPHRQFLELINRLDVALDPFPFNGHTTTSDCLWQGVPVVTLSGNTYVSRFGGSGLATLGVGELIAATRDEYIAIAVALAADLPRLSSLRGTLRQRMSESPLLDFTTFTRNLEAEYRQMWRRWLQVGN